MKFKRVLFSLLAALILSAVLAAQESPQRVISRVENTLKKAKTVRVEFTETYFWELTGEEQSISGVLILGEDDRFHISTDDQVIVSDGKTLWTYNQPANRVLIDNLAASEDALLPRQILFQYKKDYTPRHAGNEMVNDIDCVLLEFIPDQPDYFTKVRVWVDRKAWVPRKLEQTDLNENRTVYTLSRVETDVGVEAGLFTFKFPAGAEVIDMR